MENKMNNKSNKTNAFMVFMYEFMSKQKNNENLSMSDQIDKVSPHWNALSIEQKDTYKQKAKAQNAAKKTVANNNVPIAGPSKQCKNLRTPLTEKRNYMMKKLITSIEYDVYYQSKNKIFNLFLKRKILIVKKNF